jgi:hypothetical protein
VSLSRINNNSLMISNDKCLFKYCTNLRIRFVLNIRYFMKKATLGLLSKHLSSTSQVVVRADFNVPIKDGKIGDLNRIKSKSNII